MSLAKWEAWLKGIVAAAIAGAANGTITGFAAVGIDPSHFNLQSGLHATLAIAMVSSTMSGIIGVAAYLKQSPLPPSPDDDYYRDEKSDRRDGGHGRDDGPAHDDVHDRDDNRARDNDRAQNDNENRGGPDDPARDRAQPPETHADRSR
ncbi:MAG: hypothetical protein WA871_12275 [Candidatus Acidiferrales bacterium]